MRKKPKNFYQNQSKVTQREIAYDKLELYGQGLPNKIAGILHKENQDALKGNDEIFKPKSKNKDGK